MKHAFGDICIFFSSMKSITRFLIKIVVFITAVLILFFTYYTIDFDYSEPQDDAGDQVEIECINKTAKYGKDQEFKLRECFVINEEK